MEVGKPLDGVKPSAGSRLDRGRLVPAVTLADLARDEKLIWLYCRECGREREIDPTTLGIDLETPVPDVGSRMVCSRCGSRKVHAALQLYAMTLAEMRELHRR